MAVFLSIQLALFRSFKLLKRGFQRDDLCELVLVLDKFSVIQSASFFVMNAARLAATLKLSLLADLQIDEFNIKDASVSLHQAKKSLKEWLSDLNTFQQDMGIPLTTLKRLDSPTNRSPSPSSSLAYHQNVQRSSSSSAFRLQNLFATSPMTTDAVHEQAHTTIHISTWLNHFIESISLKFGIVFQRVLCQSFGPTTTIKDWNANQLSKPDTTSLEHITNDFLAFYPTCLNVSLIYQVSDALPFWADGFHCMPPTGSGYTPPTGLASFPAVFSFPETAPIRTHWPNIISLLQSPPTMPFQHQTRKLEPISQIMKREKGKSRIPSLHPLQTVPEQQLQQSPLYSPDRALVSSPVNNNTNDTDSSVDESSAVPNVGVFGISSNLTTTSGRLWKIMESTSSSLYSSVSNGGSGSATVVGGGASTPGASRSWMGSLPGYPQLTAQYHQLVNSEDTKSFYARHDPKHSIVFYDRKVDVTYVIVRVSEMYIIALLFEGAKKGRGVRRGGAILVSETDGRNGGADGGRSSSSGPPSELVVEENGEWENDVMEFVNSFIGKLEHTRIRGLLSS
ncbi:hypothetical protein BDR26DRAFT_859656 [Obelidium mucronatum]|nr:hypothetical protein BDR26DRAFT_859656 [Obelidium mucronatum]